MAHLSSRMRGILAIGITLILGTAFVIGVWLSVQQWQSWVCENRFEGLKTRWTALSGCQIRVGKNWVPAESVRFSQDGKIEVTEDE